MADALSLGACVSIIQIFHHVEYLLIFVLLKLKKKTSIGMLTKLLKCSNIAKYFWPVLVHLFSCLPWRTSRNFVLSVNPGHCLCNIETDFWTNIREKPRRIGPSPVHGIKCRDEIVGKKCHAMRKVLSRSERRKVLLYSSLMTRQMIEPTTVQRQDDFSQENANQPPRDDFSRIQGPERNLH